jgi:copper resistance protein B
VIDRAIDRALVRRACIPGAPTLLANACGRLKLFGYALVALAASSPAAAQEVGKRDWQAVVDIAEVRLDGSGDFTWESAIYRKIGNDQLHFEVDGGGTRLSKIEGTQIQALYEHSIAAREAIWGAIEHDFTDGADIDLLVIGGSVQWNDAIYSEMSAFATPDGKGYHQAKVIVTLPLSADWKIEPRAELNCSLQNEPARLRGTGPTDVNIGARLRLTRETGFSPYMGILWQRSLGSTARLIRNAGDPVSSLSFVIGVGGTY